MVMPFTLKLVLSGMDTSLYAAANASPGNNSATSELGIRNFLTPLEMEPDSPTEIGLLCCIPILLDI